jgi:hypothetical protein
MESELAETAVKFEGTMGGVVSALPAVPPWQEARIARRKSRAIHFVQHDLIN